MILDPTKLDEQLETLQADGEITTGDADEIRRFADFLEDAAASSGPKAWREHYPEDYALAVAEQKARTQQTTVKESND